MAQIHGPAFYSESRSITAMDRPGNVRVVIEGRRDIHAKLFAWHNKNSRPDLERPAWGGLEMTVVDPVNNRIAFVASERQA